MSATIAASAGNTVFTLDPAADLAFSTSYTATVTTGASRRRRQPDRGPADLGVHHRRGAGHHAAHLTDRQPAPDAIDVSVGAERARHLLGGDGPGHGHGLAPSRWRRPPAGRPSPRPIAASAGNTVFTLNPTADLAPGDQPTPPRSRPARPTPPATRSRGPQTWSFTTVEDGAGDGAILFQNDMAVIEAEDPDVRTPRSGHDWVPGQSPAGFVGDAMQAAPDTGAGATGDIVSTSAELAYQVQFPAAGTYYVWLRGYAPDGVGQLGPHRPRRGDPGRLGRALDQHAAAPGPGSRRP